MVSLKRLRTITGISCLAFISFLSGTFFEKDLNKKTTNKLTEADIKIAEAIVVLFKNHELIGCYNKNKIYFFIKEHTRLTTKEITNSITKYKKIYKNIKTDYIHKKNK